MTEIEVRQRLLHVAKIIADAKTQPAPLPKDQAEEFRAVVDKGLVEIKDDQIAFATPGLLAAWVPRYCATSISDVWEDLDQTAQELLLAYHLFRKLELPSSAITDLFLSLENDRGKSVLARVKEAAQVRAGANESNVILNSIYFKFCDVLPELDYTPSDLADHLGPVLDARGYYDLWDEGELHVAVERLAEKSQKKAEALLETFLQRPEQSTVELAISALKSLWKFDPGRAHKESLGLTKARLTPLKQIGIIALARFKYELPSHVVELSATIERLEELYESNDTNLLTTIARAFVDLFVVLPESSQLQRVRERLIHLASHEEPYVQFVVSKVLHRQAEDLRETEWFWDTLGHLSGVPACHRIILETLDWTTYGLVDHHPERVVIYLEDVVTSRFYGTEGQYGSLPNLYSNTVSHLIENQQSVLESAITRWFASKDPRLHTAAADLVGRFAHDSRRQPDRTIRLDSSELNLLDEETVQRVMCALTGHVDDYKALVSLLISVLSRETVSEHVCELMVDALDRVVLYNVPGLGGEYLRSLIEDADISEHVRLVVAEALERSDAYYAALKGRSNLKELTPPDIRVHRYHAEYQKQFSRVSQKKEFSESRLLSLIPIVPVKYGRASYSSEDGDAASPVPMRAFRTEFEMPRETIIDPFGYKLKRRKRKNMAMGGFST